MAGYEDQLPEGAGDAERLRDAFAQLLMQGNDRAWPMEALWAQQGRDQLPAPARVPLTPIPGDKTTGVPMSETVTPRFNFPTAPAGPGSPEARQNPPPSPFPGALSVTRGDEDAHDGAYRMPKSNPMKKAAERMKKAKKDKD